jgi:hypothetical protein
LFPSATTHSIRTARLHLGLLGLTLSIVAALTPAGARADATTTGATKAEAFLKLTLPGETDPDFLRGFDCDTPNVIYIHVPSWPAVFSLQIMEDMLVPPVDASKTFLNGRRIDESLFRWQPDPGGDGYRVAIEQKEGIAFRAEGWIRIRDNRVLLDATVHNDSKTDWTEEMRALTLMCLRTRLMRDFLDPDGRNVLFQKPGRDGRWMPLADVLKERGLRDGSKPYFFIISGERGHVLMPVVGKINNSRTKMVTMETRPDCALAGNRNASMSCIHANAILMARAGGVCGFRTIMTFVDLDAPQPAAGDAATSPSASP